MKLSLNILFLGWWLARQCWTSRGQTPPKPLISISPAGMVALGGNVTISCKSEDDFHGYFYVTRHENSSDVWKTAYAQKAKSNKAVFFLANLSPSDGGMYSCTPHLYKGNQFLSLSDKIYLNLKDPSLTKPSIRIRKEEHDAPEVNISIRCRGPKPDLAFALLKSREQIAYKAAKPNKNSVDFFLHRTRLEEAQSYTCQYHHKSSPFVWSEPSSLLKLPWGDSKTINPTITMTPGGSNTSGVLSTETYIRLGLAGLVLFALMLIIGFVHFGPFSKS